VHTTPRRPEGHDPLTGTSLAFERLLFFSDAVLAISITLLVIDIRLPPDLSAAAAAGAVGALWPKFLSFAISFLVLGAHWTAHRRMFDLLRGGDGMITRLNLLFLLFSAFLPFSTSLLGEVGPVRFTVVFYALNVTVLGIARAGMWQHALRVPALLRPGLQARALRDETLRSLISPLVFASSLPLAFVSPALATAWWALLVPAAWWGRRRPREG
jgi:uncharacterized membrane protein